MPRKHVYRIGDRVRIVTPQFFHRVGYDLNFNDEAEKALAGPEIDEAFRAAGFSGRLEGVTRRKFAEAIGYARLWQGMRAGAERKIFREFHGFLEGVAVRVVGKRVVFTGVFGSSGRYSNDLFDRVGNVLLHVESGYISPPMWIEAQFVEPIE